MHLLQYVPSDERSGSLLRLNRVFLYRKSLLCFATQQGSMFGIQHVTESFCFGRFSFGTENICSHYSTKSKSI